MPNNDFISNILEIKDLIITNAESTSEEIHIYFKRERRWREVSSNTNESEKS